MAPPIFCSLIVAALQNITPGLALPLDNRSDYILHEKRDAFDTAAWQPGTRVAPDAIIPLRVGLVQTNLEHGYDRLQTVSDPASPEFGKHLSADEVYDLFSPSLETINQVREWLIESRIDETNIVHSDNKGWFALELEAVHVERLFRTEIREYEHDDSGHLRLGCEEYHIPARLTHHIDYITPGVKLSHSLRKRDGERWLRWPYHPHRHPIPHHHGPPHLSPAAQSLPRDLQDCDVKMTSVCYRALYGVPLGKVNDPANSPGFFEQGDVFPQTDLNLQFKHFATRVPVGTKPIRRLIDGAKAPVPADSLLNGGESDTDLQISIPLIYPTIPTVYQVDDEHYSPKEVALVNLFNTFLDAVSVDTNVGQMSY
jgi:tripeptidyl-peptidase I